jgi:ribonucleotide reductase alpha subunit
MYERLLSGGNITLFSPHDCPDLYEAFFRDVNEFRALYEKYEKSKVRKKVVKAIDLFSSFMQERKDTGRIYLMNVDHVNDHGSFTKDALIKMSNLCCLSGDTEITVEHSDGSIDDVKIKDAKTGDRVYSRNVMTGKNEFREIKASLMTRENAQVMRITDTETGNSIVCTPDHRVYTKNRGYVEAKDLVESDQLLIE